MEHRFSGHLATSPLGKPNTSVMKDGYILFANDLTSAVGPWGQSFSANISSDATGIGNWTEEQFIKALKYGLRDGKPALQYPMVPHTQLTDEEASAMWAYLQTVPAIHHDIDSLVAAKAK